MRFSKQLHRHEPQCGINGDCYRTVVACMLDMLPEQVPHFLERVNFLDYDGHWFDGPGGALEWMHSQGLHPINICIDASLGLQEVLDIFGDTNPGIYFLLAGTSKTGVGHWVICKNNEIVWDPSLGNVGIVGPPPEGPWEIEFYISVLMTDTTGIEKYHDVKEQTTINSIH